MIRIFTVYFEGKYRPDYVTKLYHSLKRNCKVPFEFICLSDTKEVEADRIIMLPKWSDIKIHWHKLKFFSPLFGGQQPDDDIIVMDIDQIIVGDITDMINWPVKENEIVTYRKWWKKGDPNSGNTVRLNGGWYKFKSGSLKFVWDDFALNPEYWQLHYYKKGDVHFKYYGEQNYVNWKVEQHQCKITLTPYEWLAKYADTNREMVELNKMYSRKFKADYMILDDVNEKIKMVHFAGVGKSIHGFKSKFIDKYWI